MPHEVIMPALGMAQDTGVIICWRKGPGDAVAVGDALFDVETDKTTMEVEAAQAGYLTEIRAEAGADVPVGEVIAVITENLDKVSRRSDEQDGLAERSTKAEPVTQPISRAAAPAVAVPPPAPPDRILASPKAKYEARRRGVDLQRLVRQGLRQPFHVADLDRLAPEPATRASHAASLLSATFDRSAFDGFLAWAEKETGKKRMRQCILAAFAAGAFRVAVKPKDSGSLMISVLSIEVGAKERTFPDPDRQGLGDLADIGADRSGTTPDLALIDLGGTHLVDYRPPARSDRLALVVADGDENDTVATLHFSEDDLPLLTAAQFLNNFAARAAEPILQLL